MNFPRCIFCDAELNAETKPEHVLQDALGGRKTTTRVDCSACNGRFGEGIDKKLTEQVTIIRNMLQLPSGTGKLPPMLRQVKAGSETLNVKGDGTILRVARPFTIEERPDGNATVRISVNSPEELQKHIPNIAAALKIPETELRKQLSQQAEMSLTERRPDFIHFSLSFGGEDAIRAAAKSCLVLWATMVGNDEVKSENYAAARRFIVDGDSSFNTTRADLDSRLFYENDEITKDYGQVFNLIYICSNGHGRVIAHVTLYNMIAFQIVLAEKGGSPNRRVALASNPLVPSIWSDNFAESFQVPFEWLESPEYTIDLARQRIVSVMRHYFDLMSPKEIARICDDVFSKYGIGNDENIPVELRQKIMVELNARIAKFGLGLPHEEKLTGQQIRDFFAGLADA